MFFFSRLVFFVFLFRPLSFPDFDESLLSTSTVLCLLSFLLSYFTWFFVIDRVPLYSTYHFALTAQTGLTRKEASRRFLGKDCVPCYLVSSFITTADFVAGQLKWRDEPRKKGIIVPKSPDGRPLSDLR